MDYGINNNTGKINQKTIQNILNYLAEKKIFYVDSANLYGDAQLNIGKFNKNRFKIISKFSKVNSIEELDLEFKLTIKDLQLNKIYAYLAHNSDNLIQNPEIWSSLIILKNENKIEKIGFSLYNTNQLELLLKNNFIPDVIQIPYSLLDRKFEPFFNVLKQLKVEIHVRSVFLQGLYFRNPNDLPQKLKALSTDLIRLYNICNKFNIDMNLLALNYVYFHPYIDKVVIGIDSLDQLKKNCDLLKFGKLNKDILKDVNEIVVKDYELLNPSNW